MLPDSSTQIKQQSEPSAALVALPKSSQTICHANTLHTIHTPLTQCEADMRCELSQVQGLPRRCQASSHPQLHWHAHCAGQWLQSGGAVCTGHQASRHGCLLHKAHGECGWSGCQGDRGPGRS